MPNYSIGLTGLNVAQRAIELIGTNIANATTPGYHRQELIIKPVDLNTYGKISLGGVEIDRVRQNINTLLEKEIASQQSGLGQAAQELDIMTMVENAFGDIGSEGLGMAMGHYFDSLNELSAQPTSQALREQAVWAADGLTSQFRNVAQLLVDVEEHVRFQAQHYIDQANALSAEIANLNKEITAVMLRGGSGNLLRDRRGQAIQDLSELVEVEVHEQGGAVSSINVTAWGKQIVTGTSSAELELQDIGDGTLQMAVEGALTYQGNIEGGRIGALLSLYNNVLPDIHGELDKLAGRIISEMNRLHVQGVGLSGSFTDLTGMSVANGTMDNWTTDVAAGSFFIRVTDTSTGAVTRHEISVDPTVDTVTDIRDRLNLLANISASIDNSALHIEADSGYTFDFLPELLPQPFADNITGTAAATISGRYTGDTNQVFTCTVSGNGEVGVIASLVLEVRNGAGELVKTVNVGQGYAAGDPLDIGYGMNVALSTGTLNNTDNFDIRTFSDTDTSGFLAAAGINTLFSGTSAFNISVRQDVLNNPQRFAAAAGAEGSDGVNVRKMSDVARQNYAVLDDLNPQDYYRKLVTGVGQAVVVRQARQISLESVMRQLGVQRDDISGVDLNEEAAKLIIFERMYQAVSKSIAVQDKALQYLFEVV